MSLNFTVNNFGLGGTGNAPLQFYKNGFILNSSGSTPPTPKSWGVPIELDSDYLFGGDEFFYDMTYGNNKFVSVGEYGTLVTSTDGETLTTSQPEELSPSENQYWGGIAYGNNIFVVVGSDGTNGYISSSTDSENWSEPIVVNLSELNKIAYGNNKFIAICSDGYTTTSVDGETWTTPVRNLSDDYWRFLIYGNNKFIALNNEGYISTSTDGTTWTTPTIVDNLDFEKIAVGFDGNNFIVLGNNTDGDCGISTSTNGTTWSVFEPINNLGNYDTYDWNCMTYNGTNVYLYGFDYDNNSSVLSIYS